MDCLPSPLPLSSNSSSLFFRLDIIARAGPVLLGLLLAGNYLLQRVPDAPHEDGTEQVLEWHKQVVDAQQQRRQAEVHEKDDHPKVDDGMGSLNETFPLTNEEDGCSQAALGNTETGSM